MTSAESLRIRVHGIPATQGSKTRTRYGMREAGAEKLEPWREAVRHTITSALPADWQPVTGPVVVVLRFHLPRPASAPKRKRTWPIGARSGDIDKLARACLDAITQSGWWRDDSQAVELHAAKDYCAPGQRPGAEITLKPLETP